MKKRRKIIFLDVDGVLNSHNWALSCVQQGYPHGYGGFFHANDPVSHENVLWNPICVEYLRYIVEKSSADIIISSTWGLHYPAAKFKDMFTLYGWGDVPIIGITPRKPFGDRSEEIAWACEMWHPEIGVYAEDEELVSFVILDNNEYNFNRFQRERFVQTNFMNGLTFDDAEAAVRILNENHL